MRALLRSSLLSVPAACASAILAVVFSGVPAWAQHIIEDDPLTAEQERERFHLPEGFEIQLVASEPDIAKPVNLNFDYQGRLLVTSTVEYPYAAKGQGHDAVMRLTIDPVTGRATKVETLIAGLNLPFGVTPAHDGIIAFNLPNIVHFTDSDGDGTLDHRETLYGPFGQDDTHGLNNAFTRGLDGWFYACHGFRNHSQPKGAGGQGIEMTSGNTYRFKEDGSRIEHFSYGQVNPFGICFDPLGDVFTADCHSRPGYLVLRGAYYPSFGRPHDGLGFGPELMQHQHGSTGIAGIVYYAAEQFPPEYRDTLFIGNPITWRINHDRLVRHGSTYKAMEQPDFLACDDKWCRPVDLQLGPDGALYMADFYNCIIGHYEVPLDHPRRDRRRGRIWRIVYKPNLDRATIPNLVDSSTAELVARLGDPNLTVRTQATHVLVDRGPAVIDAVKAVVAAADGEPAARAHGLWVLHRLDALDEAAALRLAEAPDRLVRVHALKSIAESQAWSSALREGVAARLTDDDPFVCRAAAEALGRHPAPADVLRLLEAWANAPADDELLVHTIRIALRQHLRDNMVQDKLEQIAGDNQDYRRRLLDVSLGACTPRSVALMLRWWTPELVPAGQVETYLAFAARHAAQSDLAAVIALSDRYRKEPGDVQLNVLRGLRRGLEERGQPLPATLQSWAVELGRALLADKDAGRVRSGIDLAREFKLKPLFDPLAAIVALNGDTPVEQRNALAPLRPAAIDACVENDAPRSVELVDRLLASASEPMSLRQSAATALARINSPSAHDVLLKNLRVAPEALAVTIATGLAAGRPGAEGLLKAIGEGKASAYLLKDRNVESRLRQAGVPELDQQLARLTANLPPAVDLDRRLIAERRAGFAQAKPDVERGRALFVKTCAACHRINNEGGKIGPDLDGVGVRGVDRILEDVLDPSRIVDGGFRTTILATTDGRTLSGLFLRKEGEVLVLADSQGKEFRVPADEVAEQKLSPLSPMPANVPQLIEKEEDFYHLLGYLLAQREKSKE